MSRIRDLQLARSGQDKIDWVRSCMPVLSALETEFSERKPLAGKRIAMSIHLEAKTANLALLLAKAGAQVSVTGCNPLSTQDDVAAALVAGGLEVFAWHGATDAEYTEHLTAALGCAPDLIIDDGGDFVSLLHGPCEALAQNLIGGCEETTTGVHRLHARSAAGELSFPMLAVNDANCKHLFDNRHGTGQSSWDAIMHTTNHLVAGKTVVVAGYGDCGTGVALRAKGLGASVIVCETNPFRALAAYADGYRVMTMEQAAPLGDVFITVTGCRDIITKAHFPLMKDGVLLANAGHFDVEINKGDLEELAAEIWERKPNIRGYRMADGRILNLLGDGRLVNLAAGNGHPAEIMDLSFGVQFLSLVYLAERGAGLEPGVYPVPPEIDERVARLKLAAAEIQIDSLTPEQRAYLKSW